MSFIFTLMILTTSDKLPNILSKACLIFGIVYFYNIYSIFIKKYNLVYLKISMLFIRFICKIFLVYIIK